MVKCANCGFLALRRSTDRAIVEADRAYRTSLFNPPDLATGRRFSFYEEFPVCWKAILNFREVQGTDVLAEIQRERDCPVGFEEWIPGHEPKELQDLLDRKWLFEQEERRSQSQREHIERLEEARQKFEAEESRKSREHQETLAAKSDGIQSNMADATRSAAKWQFAGLILTAIGIISVIVIQILAG